MASNPPDFPNQDQSLPEIIQSEDRMEKNTTSPLGSTEHNDLADAATSVSKVGDTEEIENKSDGDNDSLEGIEIEDPAIVTKKDGDRDLLASSPIRPSRDQPHPSPVFVTNAWPQRSPIDHEHPHNRHGSEHRCHIDENAHASANGSSSLPSCEKEEEEQQHDEIAHALFTGSFDTISACASSENTMGAIQEMAGSGVLSPRQKTHTPTAEETIELLSQQHPNDTPNASLDRHKDSLQRYNNTSLLGDREDDGHRHRRYLENSPHSPPQKIIEIDGDDNGCGNISPIKFSPPTESTPSRHRDHHSSQYQGEFPPNMNTGDNQFCKFISTQGTNDSNEQQQHAAEISFDTSATGNHSYGHDSKHHWESDERASRKRRANDNDEVVMPASYSTATTLSEANTPPRRGTGMTHSIKEVGSAKHARSRSMSHNNDFVGGHPHAVGQYYGSGYQSIYPRVPPIPRDISHPHYAGGYYPNTPPVLDSSNFPPSASTLNKDQSRDYFRANSDPINHNAHSAKNALSSSPIRPSRHCYPIHNIKQHSHRLYRDTATPRNGPPPIIGGPWMGHGHPSELRGYPPPRAHLPAPHNVNDLHWNQHQIRNPNQQHSTLPTFPTIPTHGHPKGRRGPAFESRPSAPRIHQQHLQAPKVSPYHHHYSPVAQVPGVTTKDPFSVLRSIRKVFQGCSYLLYPAHIGVNWGSGHQTIHTNLEDLKVARCRIESAICALGGYVKDIQKREESPNTSPSSSRWTQPPTSVFRQRMDYNYRSNSTPIVRPNSTSSSSDYYLDRFHHRYFIGDNGVSWEVEENPPVFVSNTKDDSSYNRNAGSSRNNGMTPEGMRNDVLKPEDDNSNSFPIGSQASPLGVTPVDHNQKMKYRCKLCGQPKQNHVCPYKKSLVRTLGIMVCPAVNSYTSVEPGVLTVALSEMNNFVPYGRRSDDNSDLDTEASSRDHSSAYNITPGGSKIQIDHHHSSPATSSLSTSPHSNSHRSPGDTQHPRHHVVHLQQQKQQQLPRGGNLWHPRKPHQNHQGPLFMALALRPEHYRAVTPRAPFRNGSAAKLDERDEKEEGSFEYPHIPLTFLGRKRLTDTLFYLSQSIPSVTADVASLLRMARERDEWDLAVAEVLTQVVVCIHCSDGDYRLNGLKNYLLKIGIAA